jgi:hypothetical protein
MIYVPLVPWLAGFAALGLGYLVVGDSGWLFAFVVPAIAAGWLWVFARV